MRHVTGFGLTLAERVAPGWRACLELPAETGHMLPCRDGLPHRHSASRPGRRRGRWGSLASPVARCPLPRLVRPLELEVLRQRVLRLRGNGIWLHCPAPGYDALAKNMISTRVLWLTLIRSCRDQQVSCAERFPRYRILRDTILHKLRRDRLSHPIG